MRIAVIGSGVSGLVAASLLDEDHDVVVYEADTRIGGHVHTVDVDRADGSSVGVDTGFIVFNERTYPGFLKLLDRVGVAKRLSDMSLSVRVEDRDLEWNGTDLDRVFAQRGNLLRPSFWNMLREILRFNREARDLLDPAVNGVRLGPWLAERGFSGDVVRNYVVPMTAAIWSADPGQVLRTPAAFLARFFENHGMLSVDDRPDWFVVEGGSRSYVEALIAPFRHRIRTGAPVVSIRRTGTGVAIRARDDARAEPFDHVVIAAHADQALRMLDDPTEAETEILGALPFKPNDTVLHTDAALLPHRRRAWASWNVLVPSAEQDSVAVTYHMNRLQSLREAEEYCVTLNRTADIAPERVLGRWTYEHPIYTLAGMRARARRDEISGTRHTWYCGAYWRNGFHEDGVQSALDVTRRFGKTL